MNTKKYISIFALLLLCYSVLAVADRSLLRRMTLLGAPEQLLDVVTKTAGVNLDEAIVAKFGKTGVYMVKNRGDVRTISVIR